MPLDQCIESSRTKEKRARDFSLARSPNLLELAIYYNCVRVNLKTAEALTDVVLVL
jgi:hypothetical protein